MWIGRRVRSIGLLVMFLCWWVSVFGSVWVSGCVGVVFLRLVRVGLTRM